MYILVFHFVQLDLLTCDKMNKKKNKIDDKHTKSYENYTKAELI